MTVFRVVDFVLSITFIYGQFYIHRLFFICSASENSEIPHIFIFTHRTPPESTSTVDCCVLGFQAIMPTVSPLPTRRSSRISSLPQKLRDEPPPPATDKLPAVQLAVEALQHDLMEDTPPSSPKPNTLPPPDSDSNSDDNSTSSGQNDRHPSQNYSKRELYVRWCSAVENTNDLKDSLAHETRNLRTAQKR